jgi:hypothetical protein
MFDIFFHGKVTLYIQQNIKIYISASNTKNRDLFAYQRSITQNSGIAEWTKSGNLQISIQSDCNPSRDIAEWTKICCRSIILLPKDPISCCLPLQILSKVGGPSLPSSHLEKVMKPRGRDKANFDRWSAIALSSL